MMPRPWRRYFSRDSLRTLKAPPGNLSAAGALSKLEGAMNARVNQFTQLLRRLRSRFRGFGGRRFYARAQQPTFPDLAPHEALRESEERLRLVRRATGLGMYE